MRGHALKQARSLISLLPHFCVIFPQIKYFTKCFIKGSVSWEKGQLRNITFPAPAEKARKISLAPEIHLHNFSFVHPSATFGKILYLFMTSHRNRGEEGGKHS